MKAFVVLMQGVFVIQAENERQAYASACDLRQALVDKDSGLFEALCEEELSGSVIKLYKPAIAYAGRGRR